MKATRMHFVCEVDSNIDINELWLSVHFIKGVSVAFYNNKNHIKFNGSVEDGYHVINMISDATSQIDYGGYGMTIHFD